MKATERLVAASQLLLILPAVLFMGSPAKIAAGWQPLETRLARKGGSLTDDRKYAGVDLKNEGKELREVLRVDPDNADAAKALYVALATKSATCVRPMAIRSRCSGVPHARKEGNADRR